MEGVSTFVPMYQDHTAAHAILDLNFHLTDTTAQVCV